MLSGDEAHGRWPEAAAGRHLCSSGGGSSRWRNHHQSEVRDSHLRHKPIHNLSIGFSTNTHQFNFTQAPTNVQHVRLFACILCFKLLVTLRERSLV